VVRIRGMKLNSIACALTLLLAAVACGSAGETPPASALKVVPHEKLLELLPTLAGWTKGAPQGTTEATENVSRVQVDYTQDGGIGGLSIEIMDTAMNPDILAPLQGLIKANRTDTSGDAQMPTTTSPADVLGFPAIQEWTPGVSNGTLSILVAGRFTVGITGNSLAGSDVMKKAAEAMDLKKLAALK
jgi:hypothetical protein